MNVASYTAARPQSSGAASGALRAVHTNPVCTAAALAAAGSEGAAADVLRVFQGERGGVVAGERVHRVNGPAFLPNLATALNNQSIRLAAPGRAEEALAAIEEAVTIRRPWPARGPQYSPAGTRTR